MKPYSVMRTLLCLALGLAPVGLLAAFSAGDQLKTSGSTIETMSGCPVSLHGVDVSGFEYDVTGDGNSGAGTQTWPATEVLTSVEVAKTQWNCNFVRIPLNEDLWLGTGCATSGTAEGDSGAAYISEVAQVVNYCDQNNVYVLLDLHWNDLGDPGQNDVCGQDNQTGQHDMPDVNSILFWQQVASTFPASEYPGVCFDLYNEPGGGKDGGTDLTSNDAGWNFWLNGGTETAAASSNGALPDGVAYYAPGMQDLLDTVRNAGASNLIFAGGINWAFDLTGLSGETVLSPPYNETTQTYWLQDKSWGAGVVYATHIYPWKQYPCTCNNPGCFYNNAVAGVTASAKPFMVTEFGPDQPEGYSCGVTYSATASVDPADFVPAMVQWLVDNQVPFSAWNMGSSGPELVYLSSPGTGYSGWSYDAADPGESTYPTTTYFGSYVLTALTGITASACASPTDTPTSGPSPTTTPTPSISPTFTPGIPPGQAPEVYPNPFHPAQGPLRFAEIEAGSQIHIYNMIGQRVCFLSAVGNPAVDVWDGLNDNGRQVAVGIYIVYISQPSGRHDLFRVAVLP